MTRVQVVLDERLAEPTGCAGDENGAGSHDA
jgi:hypothetical protein